MAESSYNTDQLQNHYHHELPNMCKFNVWMLAIQIFKETLDLINIFKNDIEKKVLSRGLKFGIRPESLDYCQALTPLEKLVRSLLRSAHR